MPQTALQRVNESVWPSESLSEKLLEPSSGPQRAPRLAHGWVWPSAHGLAQKWVVERAMSLVRL